MGLTPNPAQERWEQRLAALDWLVGALGPTATHALLVLMPQPSIAADMAAALAAAATAAAASPGSGEGAAVGGSASSDDGGPADPQAASAAAREVVRWYRALRNRRRLPRHAAEALAARGLGLAPQLALEGTSG